MKAIRIGIESAGDSFVLYVPDRTSIAEIQADVKDCEEKVAYEIDNNLLCCKTPMNRMRDLLLNRGFNDEDNTEPDFSFDLSI